MQKRLMTEIINMAGVYKLKGGYAVAKNRLRYR